MKDLEIELSETLTGVEEKEKNQNRRRRIYMEINISYISVFF